MQNRLKNRLLEFIESRNMLKSEFERLCGLSNGFVDKSSDKTRRASLNRVSNVFPELNIDWLISGEGKMLKNITQNNVEGDNIQGHNVNIKKAETETEKFLDLLKAKETQLTKSQEQIDRLIGIIERLNNK
jgi:hypothetical protein